MIGALLLCTLLAGEAAAGGRTLRDPATSETAVEPLSFQFAGCSGDLAREVEELVREDVSWAPGDPRVTLTVGCGDTGVTLLLAGDDVAAAERKLDLTTTPPQARARTAALVATELILMGRKPVPAVLPVRRLTAIDHTEPVARVTATPSDQEQAPRPTLAAGGPPAAILAVVGTSLYEASGEVPMFVGGARVHVPVRSVFELGADAVALYQRRTSLYGTSQAFGGELSVLAEARLGFAGRAARVGLGVRVAELRLAGSEVADALVRRASGWGATVGPMMRLAVSGQGRRAMVEVALAGGWCGPDVVGTAGGGSPIGVGGWWAGLSVAAGWLLGVN